VALDFLQVWGLAVVFANGLVLGILSNPWSSPSEGSDCCGGDFSSFLFTLGRLFGLVVVWWLVSLALLVLVL